MEIRNSQPSFGMAYRRTILPEKQKAIAEYVNLQTYPKAFKAWVNKQEGFKNFHTELVEDAAVGSGMKVLITNTKGDLINDYPAVRKDITGINHWGSINYPGKKLIAKIFHPERLLPDNMVRALDECTHLEKTLAEQAKTLDMMSKI